MRRNRWNVALLVGISAAVLFCMFRSFGPGNLWRALLAIRPGWVAGACGLMLLFWLLEAGLLHVSVRVFRKEQRFGDSLNAAMIGQLFNCLTPFSSGGQPVQVFYLSRRGLAVGESSCAMIVKFIVYQVVLTLYSLATLALRFSMFAGRVPGLRGMILVGFGVNLAAVGGLVCLCLFRGGTQRFLEGLVRLLHRLRLVRDEGRALERVNRELDGFYGGFQALRANRGTIPRLAGLTFAQLTVLFLIPYALYSGFGLNGVPALSILATAAFGMNMTAFIPTPGAAGGAELGFYALFALFFPPRVLGASLLLWRGITFYLPILVGSLFAVPLLGRRTAGEPGCEL